MTDEADETWPSKELTARASQQAQVLRDSATEGGLRFQAYLPPRLALWVLDQIERGVFTDPSEAVFVLLDEARELEPHLNLRQELLKRRILSAANDPRPGVSFDEFMGTLDRLVDTARDYARAAASDNTLKAYAKDWAHFARWCRLKGAEPLPPSPEMIGLYLTDLASPASPSPGLSVSSIERRLSGMAWHYTQRGFTLDRKNRHIGTVLAGIKRKHVRPPVQKEAILPEYIRAMVASLSYDLRGLRDRAILLLGYAGGLRRSEIVSLDVHKDDTPDSGGWIEMMDKGVLLALNAKTGWREVEIGRGSVDQTCPVHALQQWLHFARINFGPVFVGTSRDGKRALQRRLNDKHVARLIKQTVLDAGIRAELSEKDRLALFSGHSLRAGLASSAEIDERYVQKQLGHASAEMTRRYQRRRDRFRVNLTKAAGL